MLHKPTVVRPPAMPTGRVYLKMQVKSAKVPLYKQALRFATEILWTSKLLECISIKGSKIS